MDTHSDYYYYGLANGGWCLVGVAMLKQRDAHNNRSSTPHIPFASPSRIFYFYLNIQSSHHTAVPTFFVFVLRRRRLLFFLLTTNINIIINIVILVVFLTRNHQPMQLNIYVQMETKISTSNLFFLPFFFFFHAIFLYNAYHHDRRHHHHLQRKKWIYNLSKDYSYYKSQLWRRSSVYFFVQEKRRSREET